MASVVLGRPGLDRGTVMVLAIAGLMLLAAVLFSDTVASLIHIWTISNYQHCFFILPVALWILWGRREALAAAPVAPSRRGFFALAAVALLWQVGQATGTQVLQHAAAIISIPALVLATLGWQTFRAAAFPLLLLLVAIPAGEGIVPILMNVTADVSVWLLQICGVPVFRTGVFVSLPGGEFQIAEVCAGLNYLLAGVTLSLIVSERLFATARARALYVAIAAVVAILGNGARAFIVMAVASATELKHFAGRDHVIFGAIFFIAIFAGLLWVGARYAQPAPRTHPAPVVVPATTRNFVLVATVLASLILVAPRVAHALRSGAVSHVRLALQLPALAGCSSPEAWAADWAPKMSAPDAEARGTYRCDGITVHVFRALYAEHEQGRELAGSDNELVPARWWSSGARTDRVAQPLADLRVPVNEVQTQNSGGTLLAWYWYTVNGHGARSEMSVKLRELLEALRFRPTVSGAYVVVAEGADAQVERMRALLNDASRQLMLTGR